MNPKANILRKFEVSAWRTDWGHHKQVVKAKEVEGAIEKYREGATKFPIEWIAGVVEV